MLTISQQFHFWWYSHFFVVHRKQMLLHQLLWVPGETCTTIPRETTRASREQEWTGAWPTQDQRRLQATVSRAKTSPVHELLWTKRIFSQVSWHPWQKATYSLLAYFSVAYWWYYSIINIEHKAGLMFQLPIFNKAHHLLSFTSILLIAVCSLSLYLCACFWTGRGSTACCWTSCWYCTRGNGSPRKQCPTSDAHSTSVAWEWTRWTDGEQDRGDWRRRKGRMT